ncbi:response regulator transcription factor [Tumidithrix helvetica PCC 7403]|uniref:response regulator n=1 Tax=Tumidithrix helvetica TaxID=3457545 RepID=UPI003CC134A9
MPTPQLVSVLLVEDELQFRRGLQTLLTFYNDDCYLQFQIVGEAISVDQAIKLAMEQNPALILLNLGLPEFDGIKVLVGLRDRGYKGKVLVLSAHRKDEWVYRAMQAGAKGYIAKDRVGSQLYDAISTVMNDEIFLAPETATSFFRMFHFYAGRSLQADREVHLTEREHEVLHWLVQGASNEEISSYLFVTVATVKAHLTAIFNKLSVNSRSQAIIKALKLGLVMT